MMQDGGEVTDFSRKTILNKIDELRERVLKPQEVYAWGLSFIVAEGFNDFSKKDPLAEKALKALLEVNEDYKVSLKELKILEYYHQCLLGEREFVDPDEKGCTRCAPR